MPPNLHAQRLSRLASLLALCAASATLLAFAPKAMAQADAPTVPRALETLQIPSPNYDSVFRDKGAAIALGKALFWDMRVGSDGKTACASCHFNAGADTRSVNALSPGVKGLGLNELQAKGINATLQASDFPTYLLANPSDANSAVLRDSRMVVGSAGVHKENFNNIVRGSGEDARQVVFDPVFHVGAANTRQVEPRNTPSVVNAVFNLRNFWDGRAQSFFNGVNETGRRDGNARVYTTGLLPFYVVSQRVEFKNASLASQAVGPALNSVEMSAAGRIFPELARKMYSLRPLAEQPVAADDSVLGARRHSSGLGLNSNTYEDLVKQAVQSKYWNSTATINVSNKSFTQAEANFSLFFGMALQAYQATLVSNDAPYDRWAKGDHSALSTEQMTGLGLFMGKGKCINCHAGPAFTTAANRIPDGLLGGTVKRLNDMIMGNGGRAVYDEGFYNIGVTRTGDDPGVGGLDRFGNPLSFAGVAKQSTTKFLSFEDQLPNVTVWPSTRIAVQGAFKTPSLRNVELTAPYFHNGSVSTLKDVVVFYNRGGNFARNNLPDLDADIHPLGLNDSEVDALVAFMRGLTDDRVRRHGAPFDHPQLLVPNGHVGNTQSVSADSYGRAVDSMLLVPAVGRQGYAAHQLPVPFLNLKQ